MDSIPQKRCSKCRELKPATNEYFTIDKSRRDGFSYICKRCTAIKSKQYDDTHRPQRRDYQHKWYQENKEKKLQQSKDYYYATLPYQRQRKKHYYAVNRVRISIVGRVYRDKNADSVKARNKKYIENNPQKRTQYNETRRAKVKNAKGKFTAADVQLQLKTQKGKCWWCGKKIKDKYHVDHRIALDKQGSNDATNIVISCPACNLSKGNKMPWEWNGRLL